MELLQLRYFYESAQNQSFSKTAQKYMVPTSSVSASIKRLENELGVKLFDRMSNRIVLNSKGKLLADELHLAFDKIDTAIDRITAESAENLEIHILIRARRKWITDLLVEFKESHPEVRFQISNAQDISDIPNLNDFDFIFDELSETYNEWHRFLLSTEKICVKASSSHPLVGKTLTFNQLEKEPFILPGKGSVMRRILENTCKRYGFTPNISIECNDRQCLLQYVEAGMGLTLGSYRALEDELQKNLSPLIITDFSEVEAVYVYHRKFDASSNMLKCLCDFLYQKSLS